MPKIRDLPAGNLSDQLTGDEVFPLDSQSLGTGYSTCGALAQLVRELNEYELSFTTQPLTTGNSEFLSLEIPQPSILRRLTLPRPSWVRGYISADHRDTDAARPVSQNPTSPIALEVVSSFDIWDILLNPIPTFQGTLYFNCILLEETAGPAAVTGILKYQVD